MDGHRKDKKVKQGQNSKKTEFEKDACNLGITVGLGCDTELLLTNIYLNKENT